MSWEPTKVVCKCGSSLISRWTSEINEWHNLHKVCLNTTPQTKEWVGLTNEQIVDFVIKNAGFPTKLAKAIEAKLRGQE